MNARPSFTLEELIEFIDQNDEVEPMGFKTAREWAQELGVGVKSARILIREGLDNGVVDRAQLQRERIDGRRCKVTGYRFNLNEEAQSDID